MIWQAAGLVGVATILVAYALVQLERLSATGAPALWLNFLGSSLILVSLVDRFNLPAALIEAAWALISALGLLRLVLRRR
ncbi:MAG TPA: hypothetical protein VG939_18435 [Caulobacteraceae bacterium]|nr:hypothetical protein [Caulobacteraceae bacterium]